MSKTSDMHIQQEEAIADLENITPVRLDEEQAIRAMWSVDFGHALLMCIEDSKRGVDSSDDVRKAAYRALRSYLTTFHEGEP